MKGSKRALVALAGVATLAAGTAQLGLTAASGGTVSEARASAFGVSLAGPSPVDAVPQVSVKVPPGNRDSAEDSIVQVPDNPLATSFTGHVESDAAIDSVLGATLQSVARARAAGLPTSWNARGYAAVENLQAVTDLVSADVIESEATVACRDRAAAMATATRIAGLAVSGTQVPVAGIGPNEVVFNELGIRIVAWETNWDPDDLGTTDGSDTVFVNALHITAPAGIDLVVSHAEASSSACRQAAPRQAPPAQPIPGSPSFTG